MINADVITGSLFIAAVKEDNVIPADATCRLSPTLWKGIPSIRSACSRVYKVITGDIDVQSALEKISSLPTDHEKSKGIQKIVSKIIEPDHIQIALGIVARINRNSNPSDVANALKAIIPKLTEPEQISLVLETLIDMNHPKSQIEIFKAIAPQFNVVEHTYMTYEIIENATDNGLKVEALKMIFSRCSAEDLEDSGDIRTVLSYLKPLLDSPAFLDEAFKHELLRTFILNHFSYSKKGAIALALQRKHLSNSYGPSKQDLPDNHFQEKYSQHSRFQLNQAVYLADRAGPEKSGCCDAITRHWIDRIFRGKESFAVSQKMTELDAGAKWDARIAKKFPKFHELQLGFEREEELNFSFPNPPITLDSLRFHDKDSPLLKEGLQIYSVSIRGPKSGHAIGVLFNDRDPEHPKLTIMDPNLGEFEFSLENKEDLQNLDAFIADLHTLYDEILGGIKSIKANHSQLK